MNKMHTETNAIIFNNMQHHQHTQHQQRYMAHNSQEHLLPEQKDFFAHLPSTRTETTSLSEGLYARSPQQQLTSECFSQYYNCGTSSHCYPPTSSSPSSNSSTSSDESNYFRPKSSANHNYDSKNSTSIGVNLRVTGQCSQGGRKYMEDYFSVAYQQSENAKDLEYAFIGIYDGHGGAEAAKFAKEHLMMEIINQRLFWSDNDHDVLRAIREGYIATHYAMWREQDKWPKTANGLPSTAGTTATVAFIRREKIYIGHVGDSGIVLGYQNENENFWRAKQLTIDHKPESVEERTRIMNSGGKVVVKSGVPRVVWNRPRNAGHRGPIRKKTLVDEIPFLAVARSLGDLWSYNSERNEFIVSPDPDVKVIPINPNTFRCLIFGTDGLWNVVSAQEAVNTVRDKEVINERLLAERGDCPHDRNQWTNPSKSLVDQALRTWSHKKMRADNTSVVTVILYPPGQVDPDIDTDCNETNKALINIPAFLEPMSYGLEYTEVQAEVPVHDDTTTYKEMALKYLPPEAYRNFNYYADESDTEGDDNEESDEENDVILTKEPSPGDLQQNTNYYQHFPTPNNWACHDNKGTTITKTGPADDDDDEEDDDEKDYDEAEVMEKDERKGIADNERQVCAINYQSYLHLEAEETNNATDSYINTFAESYNSILTASQDGVINTATSSSPSSSLSSNSNSNSDSNCQSVTPPNMHALLQEQQLYQQQCMSEEEGYSLTKLETRREQQTCKGLTRSNHLSNETTGIQTFKIFHESLEEPQVPQIYHSTTERFYHQPQPFISQIVAKPLELNSLLQQEREEEQQVAYERLQMENKLQHQQNVADFACLQTANSIITPLEEPSPVEVEYLEEDSIAMEREIMSADNSYLQEDESVQINEISSSSCGDVTKMNISCNKVLCQGEVMERIQVFPNAIFESNEGDDEVSETENEILVKERRYSPITVSKNSTCLPSPPQTASFLSSLNHNKRTKSTYLYTNVPNENLQRISNSKYNHSMYTTGASRNSKRNNCMTSSTTMTPPAATSTPIIQRQLRSTSTSCGNTQKAISAIDYSRRTLRTRNSLSKDMKAKSSLVQTGLKYPQNAITRNFLRTTAANLMVSKPLHRNDLNVTPCNRRSLNAVNNVRTANRSSIKTRRERQNVAINGSLNQSKANVQNSPHPQLNLRSRQTTSSPSSPNCMSSTSINVLRSSAASTPVIKRASLTERRSLRSMHTRSTSKVSQIPSNFSKSTRNQGTGSNLAAPPPSPKLINAVAAVAAATRARSLLNAKHVAAANGTQSVVSAVFSKRSSLRSNGIPNPAIMHNANTKSISPPASTHQTLRGRIVKKLKR